MGCEQTAIMNHRRELRQIEMEREEDEDGYGYDDRDFDRLLLSNSYLREYVGELERVIEIYEGCPGKNKCHGSMRWCELCDEVYNVCDDPRCNIHLRKDEIIDFLKIHKVKIAKEADKYFKLVYDNQDDLDNFKSELEEISNNIKYMEKDINSNQDILESYEKRYKMVPREEDEKEDEKGFRQMKLPF